jgi:hypothetical protein
MNDEQPTSPATSDKRVVNAQATIRKLKRLGVEVRLPSGIVRQRQKLREICRLHGIQPEYED